MASNLYTANYSYTLLPGAPGSSSFRISQPSREILIKSVLIVWEMQDSTTGLKLPIATQNSQLMTLQVGKLVGTKVARAFEYLGGSLAIDTGNSVILREPGQYFFESLYFMNEVRIELYVANRSPGQVVNLFSIAVETNEKIKY